MCTKISWEVRHVNPYHMEESNQDRLFSIPKSDEKTTVYIFLAKEENALVEYN